MVLVVYFAVMLSQLFSIDLPLYKVINIFIKCHSTLGSMSTSIIISCTLHENVLWLCQTNFSIYIIDSSNFGRLVESYQTFFYISNSRLRSRIFLKIPQVIYLKLFKESL